MEMMNRRHFVQASVASPLAFNTGVRNLIFGAQDQNLSTESQVVVSVFLRGGADFLNLVVPNEGPDRGHYEAARPTVQLATDELVDLDGAPFGLHPGAAPLAEIFEDNRLAIVMGAGLLADTRSHFDAQRFMDFGAVDESTIRSGWLARLLGGVPTTGLLPAVALGGSSPRSFATSNQVVAVPRLTGFGFPSRFGNLQAAQRSAVREMYQGDTTAVHLAGLQALAGSNALELRGDQEYTPANAAEYQGNGFGRSMQSIAQLIKADVGLTAVTVDLGGWDTHNGQGNGAGGQFGNLVTALSTNLAAFYDDLADNNQHIDRATVVVMSEFGRRIQQNGSDGTDHGHGGVMLVMGGKVNGGFHGEWPGLDRELLYDGADLAVTTDYRRVLSDIAIRQFGNSQLGSLFPGYTGHEPMGLVEGADLEPDYTEPAATQVEEPAITESQPQPQAEDAEELAGDPTITPETDAGSDTPVALVAGGVGLGIGVVATAGLGAFSRRRRAVREAEEAEEAKARKAKRVEAQVAKEAEAQAVKDARVLASKET